MNGKFLCQLVCDPNVLKVAKPNFASTRLCVDPFAHNFIICNLDSL